MDYGVETIKRQWLFGYRSKVVGAGLDRYLYAVRQLCDTKAPLQLQHAAYGAI